eukprot:4966355-Prymnesium_polylepis.1
MPVVSASLSSSTAPLTALQLIRSPLELRRLSEALEPARHDEDGVDLTFVRLRRARRGGKSVSAQKSRNTLDHR